MEFRSTAAEYKLIGKIADRAQQVFGADYPRLDLIMDLDACHSNGCPLDFERLLNAPQPDFVHDLAGIRRHINRHTGQLEDCFLPRTAATPAPHHQANPLYECQECGAEFNQKDAPLEDDADGEGGQNYVCPMCHSLELRTIASQSAPAHDDPLDPDAGIEDTATVESADTWGTGEGAHHGIIG